MEFDLSRVCSGVNSSEVNVGDLIYYSDKLDELKGLVEKGDINEAKELYKISIGTNYPFGVSLDSLGDCFYAFAYKCGEKNL